MIHFLTSLPRSGSTLLACLLNQRPDTYASQTSALSETMGAAVQAWQSNPATQASGQDKTDLLRMLAGMINAQYGTRTEQHIFDKSRGWSHPNTIATLKEISNTVTVIATVRPIAECLASFVKLVQPDDVEDFCRNSHLAEHLFQAHAAMKAGYEAHPDNFLFVEYNELVTDCFRQLNRIARFVGTQDYGHHDLQNIPPSGEIDAAWDIEGLHDVRPALAPHEYSAREVLGDKLFDLYQGGEFWNDKPSPRRGIDLLDTQLKAAIRGDFETAERLINNLREVRPDCNRVAFNAGWFALRNGDLQAGHALLDRGREEHVFGNEFGSAMPRWDGETGTVLLNLEGGLGDQIHGFRYAYDIAHSANHVVVACSAELAPLFAGAFPTVQHEAALGVYHDYWVPSMSAVIPFSYSYADLDGAPYIERMAPAIAGRVGVCWSGNPQFEHEQHRLFPPDMMFDAVRGLDCVSLQHGEGSDLRPGWMPQADVSDWRATQRSISQCELVITSCTSVAHLAGAMGVEVWVVLPILPYYLWALPGDGTPYYSSMTLFRQETYGEWSAPFDEIKESLKCTRTLKMAS